MSAQDAYTREQAKLRQKPGAPATSPDEEMEEDLNIEVPQGMPEINPAIFRDVEPLLFRGFLYTPAVVNDTPIVFKSLNHHEFELLGLMGGDFQKNISHKALQKQFDLFLAFGVLMIDGVSVLPNRDEHMRDIAETFGGINDSVRRKIIFHLSEINRRASKAVVLSEIYALESQSRLRWAQFRSTDLMSPSVTGFAGTELLGMNWGQLIWRAVNHFEDQREVAEREWENAKFIASSNAGKGMNKVHAQDKQRRKREREERLERRDRILRFAVFNESPSDDSKNNAQVVVARTVEELATQLKRDLKGEKDWHDMVVEQYERRAKDEHQARMQTIRDRYSAHQAEFGGRAVVGGTEKQVGLSAEEVQYRLERRRQLAAQSLAAQARLPELHDPKVSHFVEKWSNVTAPGSGDEEQVAPLALTDRTKGLPIKRGDR